MEVFARSVESFLNIINVKVIYTCITIILYIDGASVIHRYDRGSLWSVVAGLGMGLITPCPHYDGIFPVEKQIFIRIYMTEIMVSFFSNSAGILSIPQAFFSLSVIDGLCTSNIEIMSSKRDSDLCYRFAV